MIGRATRPFTELSQPKIAGLSERHPPCHVAPQMSTIFASDSAPQSAPLLAWDEMANGRGGLRPGWGTLVASIAGLGPDGLKHRADLLDRMLVEDGVTALLPGVAPKAWRCDPLPLLISAAEFDHIEAGLAQRAGLIEAVLQDVYGRQDLLAEGRIPPALVYANPAFLRPCHATDGRPNDQLLHFYAAELLRAPDGRWHVIADRTADAAGSAYALENRRALNRAIPELFRAQPPRRVTQFFAAWQDMLHMMAPAGAERPGLALLTPGPEDKLWYEHVVLARELSCTLVESSDLSLRDGALFLKTLRGLQRVDVLLRRQDGRTLDPLELEPTVHLGVTGLLDAARSGNVRIVNDPGTGCLEAPLWGAMLPRLAQRMIGEELLLPSPETLWLGEPAALARVAERPDMWRIRPALDGMAPASDSGTASDMLARAAAAPGDYVATAHLRPSLAPCMTDGGLLPQPVLVRMFLLYDGTRWQAFPGGFGRVLTQRDIDAARLPLHAICKDVWIGSEDEASVAGPSVFTPSILPVRRISADLPSRVADTFFWLGRTLERLETSARLLRAALDRLERTSLSPRENAELRSVIGCLALVRLIEPEATGGLGPAALAERLLQVGRARAPMPELLAEVSRMTQSLRDRLTNEVHSTLTIGLRNVGQALADLRPGTTDRLAPSTRELAHVSTVVLGFSATVAGLAAENMLRSGGRLFLDLGRRVERAWSTSRLIAQAVDYSKAQQPGPLDPALRLALELCDSVITYRSRYLSTLQPGPVLDLVLADESNPRALAFQLAAIRDILAELARAPGATLPSIASRLLREARDIARAAGTGAERQVTTTLPAQLRAIERGVTDLSEQISRQYFAILPLAQRVGGDEETPALRGMA